MGVFTYEIEFTSVLPPSTLFKAIVFDADEFIPKIAPRAVKSVEILRGDGGVGTIKKVYLGEGSEYNYVTHRIDGIDTDNYVYKYSLIEGDALTEKIEKISYEIKLEASADGGTIIKNISHYHTIGDVMIKGEDVKAGKVRAHGLFKIIENHLLASPFLSFLSLRQSIKTGHERIVLSEQQTKPTKHILHDGIGSNLVFLCFLCLFSGLAYRFFLV